jgi:hypothetical protein
VTLEGRIKRLEHQRDHPAKPGPDPETVAEWARLWIEASMEEPQATAAALPGVFGILPGHGAGADVHGPEHAGTRG